MQLRTRLICLFFSIALTACAAAPLESISTARDMKQFLSDYYLQPRPELVESAMRYTDSRNLAERRSVRAPLMMSFSCIFSRSEPDQQAQWREMVIGMSEPTRALLTTAFKYSPAEILEEVPLSPARNHMNWACFFATGNRTYLNGIIDALKHLEERQDLTLYMAAASAKWSLANIARRDPQVRTALESAQTDADAELSPILDDILTQEPRHIRNEALQALKDQWDRDGWQSDDPFPGI